MTSQVIKKSRQAPHMVLIRGYSKQELKDILDKTAGIWRGRGLNPLRYQRAMRKLYSTAHQKTRKH